MFLNFDLYFFIYLLLFLLIMEKKNENDKEKDKEKEIKGQIEYYLSDKNLETDDFFHKKITENPDGYIDLDLFLKCNKVKNAGWTIDEIKKALNESTKLEFNEDKNKIRRKNNKPLPELNLLNKKSKRPKEEKNKELIILSIKSEKESNEGRKQIEEEYKKLNPNLTIVYSRFKNNNGHFAIYNNLNDENKNIDFKKEFELNNIKYNINLCEGDDLKKFNDEHRSHLDNCINKEKNKKKNKNKNNNKLRFPITLGNVIYNDINNIKARTRNLFSNVKDDLIVLNNDDFNFVKDMINYHQDKNDIFEKLKDCEFIGVGKKDPHNYSKVFFGLDKDKNKKFDFVINKCIERIQNLDKKKKNKEENN